jgi:hypothetical protein
LLGDEGNTDSGASLELSRERLATRKQIPIPDECSIAFENDDVQTSEVQHTYILLALPFYPELVVSCELATLSFHTDMFYKLVYNVRSQRYPHKPGLLVLVVHSSDRSVP